MLDKNVVDRYLYSITKFSSETYKTPGKTRKELDYHQDKLNIKGIEIYFVMSLSKKYKT